MTGGEMPTAGSQSGVTCTPQHQARVRLSFCSCCETYMLAGPPLHMLTSGFSRLQALHVGRLGLEELHADNTSM